MITSLFSDAGRDWRTAARHNSKGRLIYDLLIKDLSGRRGVVMDEMIHANAAYIKTLPLYIAERVVQYVAKETLKGRRHEEIRDEIKRSFPYNSKASAKLIARTEVAKTQTAIIRSDCDIVGVDWYIWRSTKDQRTRDSHLKMNGVICSWNDPPNPEALFPVRGVKPYGSYPPGGTFNCRCYPEPIVIPMQLTTNSYKVHRNGRLVIMKKSEVLKLI